MSDSISLNSLMPRSTRWPTQNGRVKEQPRNLMEGFSTILSKALSEVNNRANESDLLTQKLVTGELDSIHEVMIAAQKTEILLELTLEIRNRALQAYEKIMTMR
ncbi:TPA: flagellar hook-basal body complex protein FliE [bacterium]|nr:flagellar hook-basal body complex protein FliE [bacterium]